jgi:hypothetical protein
MSHQFQFFLSNFDLLEFRYAPLILAPAEGSSLEPYFNWTFNFLRYRQKYYIQLVWGLTKEKNVWTKPILDFYFRFQKEQKIYD